MVPPAVISKVDLSSGEEDDISDDALSKEEEKTLIVSSSKSEGVPRKNGTAKACDESSEDSKEGFNVFYQTIVITIGQIEFDIARNKRVENTARLFKVDADSATTSEADEKEIKHRDSGKLQERSQ